MEKEIKKHMALTDFSSDYQQREIRYGRMPEYIEKLKGRTQDAAWLGGAIAAKVSLFTDQRIHAADDFPGHEKLLHQIGL